MNDMRHDQVQPSTGTVPADFRPAPTTSATRVASRRHVLLKGIGKGSAILAATVPIKTLASIPSVTANGQICTVSGTQSAAHSQATQLPTCGGLSPGYYMKIEHWPYYSSSNQNPTYTVGSKTFNSSTTFYSVFGGGMTTGMLEIMNTEPHNNAEFHWIAALLNAIKAPPGYVFPYAPQEVLDLYNSAQQAAALQFFSGYMETL